MRVVKIILMSIGAIGIIFFIFLIVGLFLYSLTPSIKKQMTQLPVSYDAVQSLDDKVDTFEAEIKEAVAAKEKSEIALIISEEEANSKIIELLAEGKLPFKELLINFGEDLCLVYAVLDNPGIAAKVGVVAQLEIIESDIKVVVIDFDLGRLPLPKSVNDWFGRLLDMLVKTEGPAEDLPLEVTGIEFTDKQLIIEGLTKIIE